MKKLAVLLSTSLLLSACAGAGGGSPVPSAPSSSSALAHGSKHKIKATIRITIPKRKHHRRVKINGHYISPATQSIEITTTLGGGLPVSANANLTPANNLGCTTGLLSPTICTVTLSLQPGNYTGTFKTFDGPLSGEGGPTDPATGNKLSAAQSVPFTIAAGSPNQINIALDGIPVDVALVPAADSTLSGNTTNGFTAAKCGTTVTNEKVSVLGVDADGNYILGAGAPVPSLSSSDSTIVTVAATPGPSSPNVFVLSHSVSSSPQGPVSLTSSVTPAADSGGSVRTAHTPLAIAGGTAICGVFTMFQQSSPALTGITSGPGGKLWFLDYDGSIGTITTDGVATMQSAPYSSLNIVTGSDGNLWFTKQDDGLVTSTPAFGITQYTTGLSGTTPSGIAVGPSNDIWFTEYGTNQVAEFSGGVVTPYGPGPNGILPEGITLGPDGNMWYADLFSTHGNGAIGKITESGSITEFTTGVKGGPFGIASAGGSLWYTELDASKIGNITTDGNVEEYAVPSGATTQAIAPGPDGALWFTENNGGIGRITTAGVVTEFTSPSTGTMPGITAGPDGAIWFTNCATQQIGRLQ
jgi:streptogramin lyase